MDDHLKNGEACLLPSFSRGVHIQTYADVGPSLEESDLPPSMFGGEVITNTFYWLIANMIPEMRDTHSHAAWVIISIDCQNHRKLSDALFTILYNQIHDEGVDMTDTEAIKEWWLDKTSECQHATTIDELMYGDTITEESI